MLKTGQFVNLPGVMLLHPCTGMKKNTYHERLLLSSSAQKLLALDIYQRATIEACGVLLGERDKQGNWLIDQVQPLNNIFHSPVYFEFAPEELLEIELAYPDRIVGVYHSHPTGYERASSTDVKNMHRVNLEQQIPWVWLIACGPFDTAVPPPERITPARFIAYHYYADMGLQQITVQCE